MKKKEDHITKDLEKKNGYLSFLLYAFFCSQKDYEEITNYFYVLYRIQIQMLHMTKSYFLHLRLQIFLVCGTVWKCLDALV